MGKVVEVRGATVAYEVNKPVLSDISLDLEEGELLGVVGPNGSGKTTLIKLILGLVKPISGEVVLRGRAGYVPQQIEADPSLPATVEELITAVGGRSSHEVLAELHLHELWRKRFTSLSGGQKKIALIGMALSVDPEVLLLDEPTAELDVHFRRHVLLFLKDLTKRGKSVLLVSHDINFVLTNADRVIILRNSVLFDGKPEEGGKLLQKTFGMGPGWR